jgi:hypothetical protein
MIGGWLSWPALSLQAQRPPDWSREETDAYVSGYIKVPERAGSAPTHTGINRAFGAARP